MGEQTRRYIDPELQRIQAKVKEKEISHAERSQNIQQDKTFIQYINDQFDNRNLKTLGISFDPDTKSVKVQMFEDNMTNEHAESVSWIVDEGVFLDFCHNDLGLSEEATYNDSATIVRNGMYIRVFAYVKPYTQYPVITISTTKSIPDMLPTISTAEDELLEEVVQSRFIICGASGAGKTFLLNYMLKKHFPKDRRVGIFQEFYELQSPNDFSDNITIPPKKPDRKWNDLEFVVEQSNLARYSSIFVGEIKGEEAWPFVVNLASGTHGGATIHGETAQYALSRLGMLCLLARDNLSIETVNKMVSDTVDFVITVDDAHIQSIDEVISTNHGKFSLDNKFKSTINKDTQPIVNPIARR